jgi:Carboxypeptidase regulatory-like domain
MLRSCRAITALLFCSALVNVMWAQGTRATIAGIVQDPTGAAIPGVELSLRSLANASVVKAATGSDGSYTFPGLEPGGYDLTVTAKGFREYLQRGISVNLDQRVRIDVSLTLGTTAEAVEVLANASPLNFDSGVQKGTIQPGALEELPLILGGHTRSAVAFVRLLPGVTTGGDDDKLNFNTRINGGTNETDEALLDGISIVDGSLGQNGIGLAVTGHPMSPEAIQEITLLTSNYDAQYGYTSSSVLTAITKSGTNSFHGTLYELLRNTDLNARPFGVANRPVDKENDFGGNIGGPIKLPVFSSGRKKSYFFVNYEGFRLKGASSAPRYTIPTAQQRAGDFSDWPAPIYDPATTRVNPNYNPAAPIGASNLPQLRDQFRGCNGNQPNVICASDPRLASSPAQSWLKYLPGTNLPGIINNYTPPTPITGTVNADSTVLDIKGDTYWRDSDHFTVSIHYFGSFGNAEHVFPVQIDNNGYRSPNYDFANRGNWDHIFRPNLINTFNFGYNDILSVEKCVDSGYANLFPPIPGALNNKLPPQIGFQNYQGFGCNGDGETTRPAWLLNDQVTWIRGKHTLSFGGEIRWLQDKERNQGNESGSYNFSTLSTALRGIQSGNDFASFLLGYVDNASLYVPTLATQYIRQKYYSSHVNDSWKVTNKLTVNLGVRWDISTPTRDKYDNFSFINPTLANPGAGGLPGSLVFAGHVAGSSNPASFGKPYPETTDLHNFAPRVGWAYAVNSKTVVRGGYGLFFQPLSYPGWNSGVSGGRDGFNTNVILSATDGGITPATLFSKGFTGAQYQAPPFFDLSFDNGKYPGVYREFNKGHLSNSQQWNLTIERQVTNDFYVNVAYVGNKGTHLISGIASPNALNPSLLSMGNALYDQFQPGQTSLDGVKIPYAGWVEQFSNGQCQPTVAQALLPFPQFCGNLTALNENAGYSTYNSLQVKAEKRMSHGLMFLGSYTWSKFLGSGADQQFGSSNLNYSGLISPYQRSRNKALDGQDVPHTFSLTSLYDIPLGKGHRFLGSSGGVSDKLFSGWAVNAIFRAQSGIPFFFRSSQCNIPGQFAMGCIPGLLPGADPFVTSIGSYDPNNGPLLNRASFENGSTGGVFSFNSGAGSRTTNIRQSLFTSMNFVLEKNTNITEKIRFQIRAEFFNIFNLHFFTQGTTWGQGGAFVTDVGSPLFGTWTGAVTTPRNIQLAARFSF